MDNRHDTLFYSLECNTEKVNSLVIYKEKNNVFILNETINNELPDEIYDIFTELLTSNQYQHWNSVDVFNMKNCKLFLERKDIPEIFDVIFLDGGEFTTYHEFQKLKNKCKYLLLDDTNTNKCMKIVDEIYKDNIWSVIVHNKNERNGILLCKNNNTLSYF